MEAILVHDNRQPDINSLPNNVLATGNRQSDTNSISEDLKQVEVNRKPANGSQMPIRTF